MIIGRRVVIDKEGPRNRSKKLKQVSKRCDIIARTPNIMQPSSEKYDGSESLHMGFLSLAFCRGCYADAPVCGHARPNLDMINATARRTQLLSQLSYVISLQGSNKISTSTYRSLIQPTIDMRLCSSNLSKSQRSA